MDPATTASLIKVGGSLLGGLFGRKSSKPKYVVPDYGKIRSKAEAAGFNPLTALTSAPGSVVAGGQNYMGSAIADAALHLADGMQEKAAQEGEAQKLREENVELAKKVRDLTIRPRVGGIYSGNVSTPSIRSALGVPDGSTSDPSARVSVPSGDGSQPSGSDGRDLLDSDPADPRREVENNPVTTGPGFLVIDNPYLPRTYIPSTDGDEPVDILELPVVGASMASSAIWENGHNISIGGGPASRPTYPNGRKGPHPNGVTRGDQGYPRNYARPPGSGKKSSRQHLPYINYPMYRPTPFAGPR